MSRIGKKPVQIPGGVTATISGNRVTVKGPKGELRFDHHHEVAVAVVENEVTVTKVGTSKKAGAIWGTTTKMIANLVEGVTVGFRKQLELNGVGYRMAVAGKKVNLALGFSHPVEVPIGDGIDVKIEGNVMTVSGTDKQQVGEFAANMRALKPVEPYKGKGFRYVGEIVRRKEGKKTTT